MLGKGSFGKVMLVEKTDSDEVFAIKVCFHNSLMKIDISIKNEGSLLYIFLPFWLIPIVSPKP